MGMLDVLKRWFGGGRKAEPARSAPQTRAPTPVAPAPASPSQPTLLSINDALDAIAKTGPKPAPAKVDRREKPRVNAREGTRVLVIDDSPTIVALLKRMLEQSGYIALESMDAESGVGMALSEAPDLIFLDIVLPGMNGFEALRRLRRDPITKHTPIVMISGNELATEQFYAQRIGADDFMKKPFSRSEVFARIEKLLDADKVPRRHLAVAGTAAVAAPVVTATPDSDAAAAAVVSSGMTGAAASAAANVAPAPAAPVAAANPVAEVAPVATASPVEAAIPATATSDAASACVASASVAVAPAAAAVPAVEAAPAATDAPAVAAAVAAPVATPVVGWHPVVEIPVATLLVDAIPVGGSPIVLPFAEPATGNKDSDVASAGAASAEILEHIPPSEPALTPTPTDSGPSEMPSSEIAPATTEAAPVIAAVQVVIAPTPPPPPIPAVASSPPSGTEPQPVQQQAASTN
jgi:CheY-like chemotaxis protein